MNDGGPAFPYCPSSKGLQPREGMTLRQFYAATIDIPWETAKAQAGADSNTESPLPYQIIEARTWLRFKEADAMIKKGG